MKKNLVELMEKFDFGTNRTTVLINRNNRKYRALTRNYGNIFNVKNTKGIARLISRADFLDGWLHFFNKEYNWNTYVNKNEIHYIFLNRYIVLKNGGVYDTITTMMFSKKDFFRFKKWYETTSKNLRSFGNDCNDFLEEEDRIRNK